MNSLKRLESYIVSFDRYGTAIGVHYKGKSSYQTRLGALCSIATYVLMTINLVNLVTAFLDGSKQTETA